MSVTPPRANTLSPTWCFQRSLAPTFGDEVRAICFLIHSSARRSGRIHSKMVHAGLQGRSPAYHGRGETITAASFFVRVIPGRDVSHPELPGCGSVHQALPKYA